MRIVVDDELCEANAYCMNCCPEVFRVDDKDELHIDNSKITEALLGQIDRAIRTCPRQALELVED